MRANQDWTYTSGQNVTDELGVLLAMMSLTRQIVAHILTCFGTGVG